MSATRTYTDVRNSPDFAAWCSQKEKRWQLIVDGQDIPIGTDWECRGPVGTVGSRVVVDVEGRPVFDRPEYTEIPNVNVVAYGIASDGTARFAVISQPRPHADNPEQPGDDHAPVVFGQIVMGFAKSVFGADQLAAYQTARQAAADETFEEAGGAIILDMETPEVPYHWPNPTFVATTSQLVFVKVDLARLEVVRTTRDEPIYRAEFITREELFRRVKSGKGPGGEVYRMCTSNSAWFIFFCTHPELL